MGTCFSTKEDDHPRAVSNEFKNQSLGGGNKMKNFQEVDCRNPKMKLTDEFVVYDFLAEERGDDKLKFNEVAELREEGFQWVHQVKDKREQPKKKVRFAEDVPEPSSNNLAYRRMHALAIAYRLRHLSHIDIKDFN
ncbi:hypothetical protein SUGI_0669340 [Cryptomeria japonica]|nr:hypothetical protein SUGI_0669340 [Cryptomeria japonica]